MGIFASFEGEPVEVDGQEVEEVFVDEAGDECVDLLRGAFGFCVVLSAHASHLKSRVRSYLVCLVKLLSSG